MEFIKTEIPEVILLKPKIWRDERGYFYESFNSKSFEQGVGLKCDFVQDNHSKSKSRVLRGLHYQVGIPQGKLVRAIRGEIFDVAVDIRRGSKTFGQWVGARLSAENHEQLWVPVGFAHGFLVLSDEAEVLYKTTDYYAPDCERCIIWNDPDLSIEWPAGNGAPILSRKDQEGVSFSNAETFP